MTQGKMCGCPHHKIVPLVIILIGLDFLLMNLGYVSDGFVATSWPVLLIVAGVMKFTKGMCKCCGR